MKLPSRMLPAIAARLLASTMLLSAAVASAQPEYDEYGLRPDGGGDGGGEMAWPEPRGDGARPEPIAPDEEELDPFDERAIELEPEVRIPADPNEQPELAPPPVQEKPAEPLLPPVEQLLREGPGAQPADAEDPHGLDAHDKAQQAEKADPSAW
ncbi:MAG TPA: hypothetical protein VEC57_05980 [Candidatus Limnocylindrales bacterium]|nr:hypothetical protein [Candidatus Limnocylindrales bacterium]